MRIPFITARQERQTISYEKAKAETVLIQQRTETLKELSKAKDKALTAIMKMAKTPTMTLNDELYGKSATNIWGGSHSNARRLSRIAEFDSPAAQSMIGRFVDMVIGPRLNLQAAPVWDLIPGAPPNPEERQKMSKIIEARWRLWSSKKTISHDSENNSYKLSRQLFEDLLIDGEYFVINRYSATRKKNPLTLQQIKPENIQKIDSKVTSGNTEVDGIEYDSRGRAVAYHVIANTEKNKSIRISRIGSRSGRVFVIHNKIGRGRRGVGLLAGIITELTKLADLQSLELQAMVINALFAVWVETEIGGDPKDLIPKEGVSGISTTTTPRTPFDDSEFEAKLNKTRFEKGGNIVQGMGEGQKLHSFDTKRPSANFESFFKLVKRNIYAAKGMSMAVSDYDFNGSYSAARGELLVFWNRVMTLRFDHSTDYESVIYQMWLWGEIDRNKFSMPGWDDEEIRDAWSNAHFSGPQRPDIDPFRSFKAAEGDVRQGFKTRQMQTAERGGGDFDDNIERLLSENDKLTEANKSIITLEKTTHSFSENVTESTTITEEE